MYDLPPSHLLPGCASPYVSAGYMPATVTCPAYIAYRAYLPCLLCLPCMSCCCRSTIQDSCEALGFGPVAEHVLSYKRLAAHGVDRTARGGRPLQSAAVCLDIAVSATAYKTADPPLAKKTKLNKAILRVQKHSLSQQTTIDTYARVAFLTK